MRGLTVIIAGLTGGIATGKSTVSAFFQTAGAHIVDADRIARQVVQPGMPAHKAIVETFGATVLHDDGSIDRERLGDIIFHHRQQKERLDAIVHPRVFDQFAKEIDRIAAHTPDAVVILDVPLLLEAGMDRHLDEIIVVYVTEAIQLQRLMARDGISETAALARIRSQMPIDEKRKRATLLIDNRGSRDACRRQTLAIYDQLKKTSSPHTHRRNV